MKGTEEFYSPTLALSRVKAKADMRLEKNHPDPTPSASSTGPLSAALWMDIYGQNR
jgi:hypothetical protein